VSEERTDNERRELHNGFGNALATAFELAFTPALFAFFGFQIDRWLGTTPVFLVSLFVFVTAYMMWKQFGSYSERMEAEQARLRKGGSTS
jgi:hypothetical protein